MGSAAAVPERGGGPFGKPLSRNLSNGRLSFVTCDLVASIFIGTVTLQACSSGRGGFGNVYRCQGRSYLLGRHPESSSVAHGGDDRWSSGRSDRSPIRSSFRQLRFESFPPIAWAGCTGISMNFRRKIDCLRLPLCLSGPGRESLDHRILFSHFTDAKGKCHRQHDS